MVTIRKRSHQNGTKTTAAERSGGTMRDWMGRGQANKSSDPKISKSSKRNQVNCKRYSRREGRSYLFCSNRGQTLLIRSGKNGNQQKTLCTINIYKWERETARRWRYPLVERARGRSVKLCKTSAGEKELKKRTVDLEKEMALTASQGVAIVYVTQSKIHLARGLNGIERAGDAGGGSGGFVSSVVATRP